MKDCRAFWRNFRLVRTREALLLPIYACYARAAAFYGEASLLRLKHALFFRLFTLMTFWRGVEIEFFFSFFKGVNFEEMKLFRNIRKLRVDVVLSALRQIEIQTHTKLQTTHIA